jgi:hypothetical protein
MSIFEVITALGKKLYPNAQDVRQVRVQVLRWIRANQYLDIRGIRIPRAKRLEGI